MKRVAFTIIYNGLHHLKHNGFADRMASMFDHWVIVEGAANNGGSTAWCKQHHGADNSTDGTIEYLNELEKKHRNISVFRGLGKWRSKDDMCNHALKMLGVEVSEKCFLWEVDADEQWTLDAIEQNEQALISSGKTTGAVRWNHFVSHDLIAVGDWGGNLNTRLWIWDDANYQRFLSHEPPVLSGTTDPIELPYKCNHYSYYFEKDVLFKSRWYGGHQHVHKNWINLQLNFERKKIKFPLHISYLFGKDNWIGRSNTNIVYHENKDLESSQLQREKIGV